MEEKLIIYKKMEHDWFYGTSDRFANFMRDHKVENVIEIWTNEDIKGEIDKLKFLGSPVDTTIDFANLRIRILNKSIDKV